MVAPDVPCEGELRGSAQPHVDKTKSQGDISTGSKRKQPEEDEYRDWDAPRKT